VTQSKAQIEQCSLPLSGQALESRGGFVARSRGFVGKVDSVLDPVAKRIEVLGHWEVSLMITIAIVLIVVGARYYYSFVTGYIVPDEAWYYNTFILDRAPVTSYRPAFLILFVAFFQDVNVWTFLLRGALYSSIWAVGCVLLFFAILRRLKTPQNMTSLLLLSLPLFPVFIVFVPTILTETLGLLMALMGVYFGVRYVQGGGVVNSLVSVVFFVLAYNVREPYSVFLVGNILLFLVLSIKRRSLVGIAVYATLVILLFPIPIQLEPLRLAQPVYTLVMNLIHGRYQAPILTPLSGVPSVSGTDPDLPRAIAVGLAYGFNPLFALFAGFSLLAVSFDLFKRRSPTPLFLTLNAIWSVGAFVIPAAIVVQTLHGALSRWTSAIIRTTHAALPCVVGFPSLYGRLKVRRVAGMTLILLILGSTQVWSFAETFQRSLSVEPVNRLSLDYRAPYYRMYLVAKDSGKTLVFGGLHMRGIRMYMAMLPNVVLAPLVVDEGRQRRYLNETEFQTWLEQNWDSVFLYDDWYTIEVPLFMGSYPQFYAEILTSREYPGYSVETLWADGESYALKMVST